MAEAQVEMAAAGEPGRRFASDEFFFLLQRIDRLDEKLTAQGAALNDKLTGELKEVQRGLNGTLRWTIGLAVACFGVMAGVLAVLIALMAKL